MVYQFTLAVWTGLMVLLDHRVSSEGQDHRPELAPYNNIAPAHSVFLTRPVFDGDREGILQTITVRDVTSTATFNIQVWRPTDIQQTEHQPNQYHMIFSKQVLVHESEGEQAILLDTSSPGSQCPYVQPGDRLGLYSSDTDLPIPYRITDQYRSLHAEVDADFFHTGLGPDPYFELDFNQTSIEFAIVNIDTKGARRPQDGQYTVFCPSAIDLNNRNGPGEDSAHYELEAPAETVYLTRQVSRQEGDGILESVTFSNVIKRGILLFQVWRPVDLTPDTLPGYKMVYHRGLLVIRQTGSQKIVFDGPHCPYVYPGDRIGLYSESGILPIPYRLVNEEKTLAAHVSYDQISRLSGTSDPVLEFNVTQMQFAVADLKTFQSKEPDHGEYTVHCVGWNSRGDGRSVDKESHRTFWNIQTTTASTEPEPTLKQTEPAPTPKQEASSTDKELYIAIGCVGAVSVIAIVSSLMVCIHFRRQKVKTLKKNMRNSLVPIYHDKIIQQLTSDQRSSQRNPVYGINCEFLRSLSLPSHVQSGDGSVSYIVIPESVLSATDYGHYEDMHNVLTRLNSTASDTCSTPERNSHTYLDLVADDDSGILAMSISCTSSLTSKSESGIDKETSGPNTPQDQHCSGSNGQDQSMLTSGQIQSPMDNMIEVNVSEGSGHDKLCKLLVLRTRHDHSQLSREFSGPYCKIED